MALDILKPRRAVIEWSMLDAAQGTASSIALLSGERDVWNKYFAGHAMIDLALRAEVTRVLAEGLPPVTDFRQWEAITAETPVLGATDKDLDRVPEQVAQAYRAMRRGLTSLYNTRHPVKPDTPTIDVPIDIPGALPIVIALTVVGVAAIAGTSWFLAEQAESKVQLEKHRITVIGQVDLYLKDLQARIAAGAPLPDPPDAVVQAAQADAIGGPLLLGAGLILGAAAVGGAVYALRKPQSKTFGERPNPRRRMNPSGARRLPAASTEENPAPRRRKKKASKRRAKKTAKRTRKRVVRPHRRASRKCARCGKVHTRSQHWSHRFAATKGPKGGAYRRKRKAKRKMRRKAKRRNPVPRKRRTVVRAHKRASRKCAKCGKVHTRSQHWSHKFAAKKGPRGGAYKKKRKASPKRKRAAARRRPPAKRKAQRKAQRRVRRSARRKR